VAATNPNLLNSRTDTIQQAIPALIEVLGRGNARAALQRNAQLLRVRADTIKSAMAALVALLGAERAEALVLCNSSLLMTRSETIMVRRGISCVVVIYSS
jgi:hypothetical protein